MKKKKLLFVIDSLECGGAEKSLVSLLNTIDKDRYEVDLQLFKFGGEFEKYVPDWVNVLVPLDLFRYLGNSISNFEGLSASRFLKCFFARITFSVLIRIKPKMKGIDYSVLFWEIYHSCFNTFDRRYDVAIAYGQKLPTFYVSDFIGATKKVAWVNAVLTWEGKHKKYASQRYNAIETICCVSNSSKETFQALFPEHKDKTIIIHDITNERLINSLSTEQPDFMFDNNKIKILTVGRLANFKGYDIAIKAAKKLKDEGINFAWYAIGEGPLRKELESLIKSLDLVNDFILLGAKQNPYPYFLMSDIYVQTSVLEGYGITIAEAKTLNTPLVSTNFDTVYDQVTDGVNGLIVEKEPENVCEGIIRLIQDSDLYQMIKENLKSEEKGNRSEISKFYSLVDN